jgi:predicted MPP superfamily phosphohydrolase
VRPPPSLLLAPLPLLAWALAEPHLPVLRRATVPVLPAGARPLRVLHVSDLHLLPRSRRRAAWVRRLAAEPVDLVVSTGDHVSSAQAVPLLAGALGALTATGTPGVFVAGNNDYYTPVRPSLRQYLGDAPPRRAPTCRGAGGRGAGAAGWTDLTSRRTTVRSPACGSP